MTKAPYEVNEVPFIFKNRDLTVPANTILKEWIRWALEECPDELKFLHRRSQEYTKYGGANSYTFKRWLTKLEKDTR